MGLEPTRPQWPRDFKSLVSTDSTIQASGKDSAAKIVLFDKLSAFSLFFLDFESLCSWLGRVSCTRIDASGVERFFDQLKDAVDAAQAVNGAILPLFLVVGLKRRSLVVIGLQSLAGGVLVIV